MEDDKCFPKKSGNQEWKPIKYNEYNYKPDFVIDDTKKDKV